jgi:hypothetical protein
VEEHLQVQLLIIIITATREECPILGADSSHPEH